MLPGGQAFVAGVELARLGNEGVLGQCLFYWHLLGLVAGQFIEQLSVHHLRQRCIVLHQADHATVCGNICFDLRGHALFLEDHIERGNLPTVNLVVLAHRDDHRL